MKITPPGFDDENPYQQEMTEARIDRIGQRLTLLGVLLPIAIAVILAFGYLDLKRRVVGLHDNSAAKVQALSEDLESRFSTLSIRLAELEPNLQNAIKENRGQQEALGAQAGKIEEKIKRLETQKADASEVKSATESLGRQLAPLAERLSTQDQTIKATVERVESRNKTIDDTVTALQAKMTALAEDFKSLRDGRAALEAEVKSLSATLKTDREGAQTALAQQKEASARQLRDAVQLLEERLETLGRRIDRIQSELSAVKALPQASTTTAPVKLPRPAVSSLSPAPAPAVQPSLPELEPGQIIEKSLD